MISVPLWLAIAVAFLAAWAFYEHLLLPALRWMVTHPANQVIDDISSRLRIGIRRPSQALKSPTTLTRRAFGAHTAKLTPATPSITRTCAPSFFRQLHLAACGDCQA